MTIEKTYPIEGYRITAMVKGYYHSKLYIGYSKKTAIAHFKRETGTETRLHAKNQTIHV